ncbi:NAD(P)-dependent oxidoreductase [Pseudomonas gingeri]|uniref:NAD(P)-dependent oxidoreductase n=2 Tax=Pseudomonas gingeri TaxID=117681 RepID=A0A7Y7YFF3_9PSED|nr:NAD(P)-dependent oxidoreductase [Pseudomonas gingeri]NWA12204.1 NAD(P)-dependent oxidoreductase [Pseudomonas gingeri]NWA57390.1 NAD(P)-dependent oxidoreductase [Pseudomonas gingeri]NWA93733.1 NAD(P)-dependent oxidoreductase [Pseudomonas gingeri]NWB03205.1 NAD(P)-dependent oxidoreductase [Pseudomonas gingeri]
MQAGHQTTAFTRRSANASRPGVSWQNIGDWHGLALDTFLSLAPIWVVPEYLDRIANTGVQRVVVLSSTSRFTKEASPDAGERQLALRLKDAEEQFVKWALERKIQWVILRPTMIYGFARDQNITEIARFIRRFGFFPLIGGSTGLRQPVHAEDVVRACLSAMTLPDLNSGAYNLSGAETLPYHTMVSRLFQALGRPEHTLALSTRTLATLVSLMRCLPRYRHLSSALVERMNQDLVFDHSDARDRLGFSPRPFELTREDVPGR